ncbi:hypothetical protein [Blastococcus sp. SYSU DS0533]
MALLEGLAALAAKFAGASTVAQVATGVGIATAGVTGAGAVGVLPAPVQDAVASTVEAVTPFEVPDSGDGATTEPTADREAGDAAEPEVVEEEAADEEATEDEEATDEEATEDEEATDEEATEDDATQEETGLRGLDNAIAHADEHAQGALAAAQARQAAHDSDKAAREAAREAEKSARDAAKAARAVTTPVEEPVEQVDGAGAAQPADQGRGKQGRGGN